MNVTFFMIDQDDRMADDGPAVRGVLAANVRRVRIARHLSLSQLARATTMSKATLSGIESGGANPTVETLAALAGALRVSLGELLEQPPLGEIAIVRAAAGAVVRDGAPPRRPLGELRTGAVGAAAAAVELCELVLAPRESCEAPARASGARACVYVRTGKLLAGPVERPSELARGDYASFPADVPHCFEALRDPVKALLAIASAG
jgi:transcriptional regulator with XRE-family HTH domain